MRTLVAHEPLVVELLPDSVQLQVQIQTSIQLHDLVHCYRRGAVADATWDQSNGRF